MFAPPRPAEVEKGADYVPSYHGFSGPLHTGFQESMFGGSSEPAFVESVVNLTKIRKSADLNGGEPNCVSYVPLVSGRFFPMMNCLFNNIRDRP
jgi:choline dehydrogenase